MSVLVELQLTSEEPLIATDGSSEGMGHRTLDYISGSKLLGAYAFAWRKQNPNKTIPDNDPDFVELFLDGSVCWGNAYPSSDENQTVPIPLCYQKIKNYNGLPCTDGDAKSCRVFNMLLVDEDNTLAKIRDNNFPQEKGEAIKCKKLDAGFMNPNSLCRVPTPQSWSMHVAIENRHAAESLLFGYSAMTLGRNFVSAVLCKDEETAKKVERLVKRSPVISVGRSRSAGYGRVQCLAKNRGVQKTQEVKNTITLFLESDYVPLHSWQTPLESLKAELTELIGSTPEITAQICSFGTISGFNGLWVLPRRSVPVITKGSVLTFSFTGKISLPSALGAQQQEGYGRVRCNPSFLLNPVIRPKTVAQKEESLGKIPANANSSLLSCLRRRTLTRALETQAVAFISNEKIDKFLSSVATIAKPNQTQLMNIRNLVTHSPQTEWGTHFEEILKKTPGEQWKTARAFCPVKGRREHLSDIMLRLFSKETLLALADNLPTPPLLGSICLSKAEREYYESSFCRLAMIELVSAWEKIRRRAQVAGRID